MSDLSPGTDLFHWSGPILDPHAHPRGLGDEKPLDGEFIDEEVAYSRRFGVMHMVSLGEVLFRRTGFSKVEIRWLNDRNLELAEHSGGFFYPFCFLDPTLGRDFVREEGKRCVQDLGFRGLKLEVACNAADPSTAAVFELAAELEVPVMVHATDTSTIGNRDWQSDPEDVRAAVKDHPEAKIITAHLTAIGMRGVWEIADLPHVNVDTSGMQPDGGLVEYAVQTLGADRVLYGSDMFARDLTAQIGQVLGADISREDMQRLFFDNAVRVLGLSDEEVRSIKSDYRTRLGNGEIAGVSPELFDEAAAAGGSTSPGRGGGS
jgi:hypothetical protein